MNWTSASMLQVFLVPKTIEQNTCSYFYHTSPEMSLHRKQDILSLITLNAALSVTCCRSALEVIFLFLSSCISVSLSTPCLIFCLFKNSSAWLFSIPCHAKFRHSVYSGHVSCCHVYRVIREVNRNLWSLSACFPNAALCALFGEFWWCLGKINIIFHQENLELFPREISNS